MGNVATSGKRDRNFSYSIDGLPVKQNSDDGKGNVDFIKKKQFLYQQSCDATDDVEEVKVRRDVFKFIIKIN